MQKVDIIIGVVGAVALLATGIGVALYDSGETNYSVGRVESALAEQNGVAVSDTPTELTFMIPANSYGASFQVAVTATGAGTPGSATIDVTVEGDGYGMATGQGSITLGAQGGSGTATVQMPDWAEPPEAFTGSEADVEAMGRPAGNITVTITVSGGGSPLPVPGAGFSFSADVGGTAKVYTIQPETPDPEAL